MLEMHVELDHEISAAGRMHEDCFMGLQTDAPAKVDGGAPACDDTGTVTRVSSSSAGVCPATGLEPPLAAMKMDMYVPPPPPPPPPCVCPAQTEGSMSLVYCCAIQPQPLSLQQQRRQPPMQPPTPVYSTRTTITTTSLPPLPPRNTCIMISARVDTWPWPRPTSARYPTWTRSCTAQKVSTG
ncbi:hypothetical protein MY8738_000750 [Beauveria namnaoensis]